MTRAWAEFRLNSPGNIWRNVVVQIEMISGNEEYTGSSLLRLLNCEDVYPAGIGGIEIVVHGDDQCSSTVRQRRSKGDSFKLLGALLAGQAESWVEEIQQQTLFDRFDLSGQLHWRQRIDR